MDGQGIPEDAERQLRGLMVAAQGGDKAAYRALLSACVPTIQRVARGLRVRPGSVDDVVQDVLLTVHRVLNTYDPDRPFTGWLVAIAKRRAIDLLRREGRASQRETHEPLAYENAADPREPQALIEERGQRRQLNLAVESLPPGQREAVQLLALRGHSLAEGSELSGRSKVALKVNLHRAIRSLRARLSGTDSP